MKEKIQVALGKERADLVLKNASYINVYTQTIEVGDIAIVGDTIVGIGNYEGKEEIDCSDYYVAPGFIDSHVHIESAMVTPEILSQIIVNKGVTTIVADPHEIANVLGTKGIKLMLSNSQSAGMDIFFMLPSCVPAVSFEDNGATLNAKKLRPYLKHPRILGLGEVMDVNAVLSQNQDMLMKVKYTQDKGKHLDGHCPKTSSKELNAYLCAGITTDHECTSQEEALEKVSKGMYVMMREGSQARDLKTLVKAVNEKNYQRFLFCTDDRHIEDLMEEGSIDNCIRLAIQEGLEPIKAYTIASFNPANCFKLFDRGAIAPLKKADLVIFKDLEKLYISQVIKNGKVVKKRKFFNKVKPYKTMHLKPVSEDTFYINYKNGKSINVIKALPGSLYTEKMVIPVQDLDKYELNKIAVLERHKMTGKHFTGYITGLGLKNLAIAQTIAHDSHNVVCIGSNDKDMMLAVNTLIEIGGGIVIVSQGKVLEFVSLPIGGIMTDEDPQILYTKMKRLNYLAKEYGIKDGVDPFITLSFMALPVIPEIKITPRGLFYYQSFNFIDLME
ncbi:MAG TPA: adenine deaminase [Haloplasmataceae bacterium]